jgi:hypothetical protein
MCWQKRPGPNRTASTRCLYVLLRLLSSVGKGIFEITEYGKNKKRKLISRRASLF